MFNLQLLSNQNFDYNKILYLFIFIPQLANYTIKTQFYLVSSSLEIFTDSIPISPKVKRILLVSKARPLKPITREVLLVGR